MPEEFAIDGVGNALHADAFLAIIQQEAVSAVIVAADFSNERVRLLALRRGHVRESAVGLAFDGW